MKDKEKSHLDAGAKKISNKEESLSEAAIQETFEILGLSDESKRKELDHLKTLASGFEQEYVCWISSHSISQDDSDDRSE